MFDLTSEKTDHLELSRINTFYPLDHRTNLINDEYIDWYLFIEYQLLLYES